MKLLWGIFWVIILSDIGSVNKVKACTSMAFKSKNKKRSYVIKNFDFPSKRGLLIVNKRNTFKKSIPIKYSNGDMISELSWASKYGSITFNAFGRELPQGGINEKGLIIESHSFSPISLKTEKQRKGIHNMNWIQYQLDNFKNVDEVIENINRLSLRQTFISVHFLICDFNKCVNVDPIGLPWANEFTLHPLNHEKAQKIFTNHQYTQLLTYLTQYKSFGFNKKERPTFPLGPLPNPTKELPKTYKEYNKLIKKESSFIRFVLGAHFLKMINHYFVTSELPHDPESELISALVNQLKITRGDGQSEINLAFFLLDNVEQSPHTQWKIVYKQSISSKRLYFKLYDKESDSFLSPISLALDQTDFECKGVRPKIKVFNLSRKDVSGPLNKELKPFNVKETVKEIKEVYNELGYPMDTDEIEAIVNFTENTSFCRS